MTEVCESELQSVVGLCSSHCIAEPLLQCDHSQDTVKFPDGCGTTRMLNAAYIVT